MAIDLIFSPAQPNNPFEIFRRELLTELANIPVPTLDVSPHPEQFEAINDHIRLVAALADEWIGKVGAEVRSNGLVEVQPDLFASPFTEAIDGQATWAIDNCAQAVREELVA